MNFSKRVVLSSVLLSQSALGAGFPSDMSHKDRLLLMQYHDANRLKRLQSSEVYQSTVASCRDPIKELLEEQVTLWSSTWNSFLIVELWSVDRAVDMALQKGLSPHLAARLNDDDFIEALNDCFGDREIEKAALVLRLIGQDLKGTAGGTILAFYLNPLRFLKGFKAGYPKIFKAVTFATFGVLGVRLTQFLRQYIWFHKHEGEVKANANAQIDQLHSGADASLQGVLRIYDQQISWLEQSLKNPSLGSEERVRMEKQLPKLKAIRQELFMERTAAGGIY